MEISGLSRGAPPRPRPTWTMWNGSSSSCSGSAAVGRCTSADPAHDRGIYPAVLCSRRQARNSTIILWASRFTRQPFTVVACAPRGAARPRDWARTWARHLDGCRIGFDLGASDRKVSAVIDGEASLQRRSGVGAAQASDPDYHYSEIMAALENRGGENAAAWMPSAAARPGSIIDNRPMVASLFRSVPPERFDEVRSLFLRIRAGVGGAAGGHQRWRCDRPGRRDVPGR